MVWFWMKTWHFVHGRFHKTGSHKKFAMYSDISLPKVVKSVYFASIMFMYLGNFTVFPAKSKLWATLLRVFCEISLISPQKIVCFMSYVLLFLHYVCVLSNHCIKLNFMPVACLLSKLFYFVAFSFQNVKFCATHNV